MSKILVVEDTPEVRKIIELHLKSEKEYTVNFAFDGEEALTETEKNPPDLILLDVMMPGISGFDVCKILKNKKETQDIPIIFITALNDINDIVKGFENGGNDYVTKPFKKLELLSRIKAHLKIKNLQDDLIEKNELLKNREKHLEKLVEEKTLKIENITFAMVNALESANHLNDDDTGNHIRRVREYAKLIAEKYGCDDEFIKKINMYASLHDIGKVGIDSFLLKKTDIYTKEEREKMKDHVIIGKKMLSDENIDEFARNIAYYHHEKWDGTGYVNGLKGEKIPLEARIVSFADVYDALTTKRVYKEAFSQEKTNEIILKSKGKHFEPKIVDIYFEIEEEFIKIKKNFQK